MVTLQPAPETGPPETVLDALVKLACPTEAALVLRRAIGLDPFKFRATKKSDHSCDRAEGIRPGRGAGEMTALGVEAFSNA